MKQYGFLYDSGICIGCRSCQFACQEANQLAPGTFFRRVLTIERGEYIGFFSAGCNQCLDPACAAACRNGAMYRDDQAGLVVHDDGRCIGCGACLWACPYGAVFMDSSTGKSARCTGCLPRLEIGQSPACAAACPTKALQFGEVPILEALGGQHPLAQLLPDSGRTRPSLRILPKKEGTR